MSTVKDLSKVIDGQSAAKFVESYSSDLDKVNHLFSCNSTLWNWDMVNSSIRYGLKKKGVTEKSAKELYEADPVDLTGKPYAMKWYVLYKLSLAPDTRKTVKGDELPAMFLGSAEAPSASSAPETEQPSPVVTAQGQIMSEQVKQGVIDVYDGVADKWAKKNMKAFKFGDIDQDAMALLQREIRKLFPHLSLKMTKMTDHDDLLNQAFQQCCLSRGKWSNADGNYTVTTFDQFKTEFIGQSPYVAFLAQKDDKAIYGMVLLCHLTHKDKMQIIQHWAWGEDEKEQVAALKKKKKAVAIEILCARLRGLGALLLAVGKLYSDYVHGSVGTLLEPGTSEKSKTEDKLVEYYNQFVIGRKHNLGFHTTNTGQAADVKYFDVNM